MNKQELIEKAVLAFEGKWIFSFSNLCTPASSNTAFAPHSKFESIRNVNDLGPHWLFVCTCQEFEEAAKRMGYINGYRWGVEYPVDCKRPDIPNDIEIEVSVKNQKGWSGKFYVASRSFWDSVERFKIVDERYKPKEVSKILESNHSDDSVSETTESNWFERGELPPVGTVCEYSLDRGVGWFVCEIRYVVRGVGVVMYAYHLKQEQYCSVFPTRNGLAESKFRPIRTEREKFIDDTWGKLRGDTPFKETTDVLGQLYDLGFCLPESK